MSTFDERWTAWWAAKDAAEEAGDKEKLAELVPEGFALMTEQDEGRKEAIARGFERARERPGGIERYNTKFETNTVLEVLDVVSNTLPITEEVKLAVAEEYTRLFAGENALKHLVLIAYNMETMLTDWPPINGIVGKAIDEAIETLSDYARSLDHELYGVFEDVRGLAGPAS